MADQIYKVRDPSGNIREISGPAGASDEQVIAKAKELFGGGAVPAAPQPTPQATPSMRQQIIEGLVPLARPGGIGSAITKGLDHAAYNTGAFVNDQAAKVLSPEVSAGLGVVANTAVQALPMLLGGEVGKVAQPMFERGGEKMMQKALRPTLKALETGKAQRAATTMLEDGLNPTRAGVGVMKSGASEKVAAAEGILSGATGSLDKVPVVNRAIIPLLAKVEKQGSDAGIKTVLNTADDFLNKNILQGSRQIPVQLAQELKQGIYSQLGDAAYGIGLKPAAERDTLKAIARQLKLGIEGIAPEVAPLNARASELINAAKIAERRVLMGGNNNVLPLGASVATATHNPVAALGLWANSSDLIKALLARALYSGQIPANLGRMGGGAVGALSDPTGALYQQ